MDNQIDMDSLLDELERKTDSNFNTTVIPTNTVEWTKTTTCNYSSNDSTATNRDSIENRYDDLNDIATESLSSNNESEAVPNDIDNNNETSTFGNIILIDDVTTSTDLLSNHGTDKMIDGITEQLNEICDAVASNVQSIVNEKITIDLLATAKEKISPNECSTVTKFDEPTTVFKQTSSTSLSATVNEEISGDEMCIVTEDISSTVNEQVPIRKSSAVIDKILPETPFIIKQETSPVSFAVIERALTVNEKVTIVDDKILHANTVTSNDTAEKGWLSEEDASHCNTVNEPKPFDLTVDENAQEDESAVDQESTKNEEYAKEESIDESARSNAEMEESVEEAAENASDNAHVQEATEDVREEVQETAASIRSFEENAAEVKALENDAEIGREFDNLIHESEVESADEPCTSSSTNNQTILSKSVIESTHDISAESELKLTESELQIGKTKPYWIPDMEFTACMLCSGKFTLVNRRHHCRCCGRVLCGACCQIRRVLPYMYAEESEPRKQRICTPCNKTLDRIELYEKLLAERNATGDGAAPAQASGTQTDNSIPPRKKSVLKVRACIVDSTAESTNPLPATPNASFSADGPVDGHQRRNVIFRDGVKPGADNSDPTAAGGDGEAIPESGDSKRSSKRLSRKTLERRVEDEYVSLLGHCEHLYCTRTGESELQSVDIVDVWAQICDGVPITVAIRRNLYALIQITTLDGPGRVLCLSTRGFDALGVDELVIVVECASNTFDLSATSVNVPEMSNLTSQRNGTASYSNKSNMLTWRNRGHLRQLLGLVEHIFNQCILPGATDVAGGGKPDDRLGIRRCGQRMRRFFELPTKLTAGLEAAAVYLTRPCGQSFGDISLPDGSFYVGIFFKKSEVPWGNCLPDRVLYALGRKYSSYPMPIFNAASRESMFTDRSTNSTVLKVLNDFRNFNYRMMRIEDSFTSLTNTDTTVIVPKWAVDQLKSLIDVQRNMFGWALDFHAEADSHLTCCEEASESDGDEVNLKTHIFARTGQERKFTGSSFIIFDGALRPQSQDEAFTVSIVEDGIIIRLSPDTMTAFVRSCEAGADFRLASPRTKLAVRFVDEMAPEIDGHQPLIGRLTSAIDAMNLTGNYQYGLVMSRALRSLYQFRNTNEWGLRLVSVINLDCGKFPGRVQSKYFETCEHLTLLISRTLEEFVNALVVVEQRSICVRIHVANELATYETASWPNLEDQHELWITDLDRLLIPVLYGICPVAALTSTELNVELQLRIVSIRQLSFCCVPHSARGPK